MNIRSASSCTTSKLRESRATANAVARLYAPALLWISPGEALILRWLIEPLCPGLGLSSPGLARYRFRAGILEAGISGR